MRIQLGDSQERVKVSRTAMRRVARAAWGKRQPEYDQVNVVLVDDQAMRSLNATYRFKDRVTDVLAFDLRSVRAAVEPPPAPGMPRTGEVFVSTDRALRQARAYRVPLARELARLVIHGLLHLQGFDHQRPAERRVMRREEARVMRAVAPLLGELVGSVAAAAARAGS